MGMNRPLLTQIGFDGGQRHVDDGQVQRNHQSTQAHHHRCQPALNRIASANVRNDALDFQDGSLFLAIAFFQAW
jgi:hypothetical protein